MPADIDGDDFDRPLAELGRADAGRVGLATSGQIPDLILASPARRTRETLDLVRQSWPRSPTVLYETPLYLAEWDSLLERLRALEDGINNVWIVGHNPGLHELAIEFARHSGMRLLDNELGRHFPTGSRACFSFDIVEWRSLPTGKGFLSAFVTPR